MHWCCLLPSALTSRSASLSAPVAKRIDRADVGAVVPYERAGPGAGNACAWAGELVGCAWRLRRAEPGPVLGGDQERFGDVVIVVVAIQLAEPERETTWISCPA